MLIPAPSPGSSFGTINKSSMTIVRGGHRSDAGLYVKAQRCSKGLCCVEHAAVA